MVEELGSILVFAGRPLPNHAGTKLVFIQYRTNDAWGIYVREMAHGKRKLLDVLLTDTWREGVVYEQLRTFGWSPDDQHFAYSRGRQRRIVICDVESGKRTVVYEADKPVTSGAWLSPQTLVCTDGERLLEFVQSAGQWTGPRVFTASAAPAGSAAATNPPVESLQAFSADTLLWQQGDAIWSAGRDSAPVKVWQAGESELVEYHYSREARQFLVHGRDQEADFLAELFPGTPGGRNTLTNQESIGGPGAHPTQARLLNGGRGYAYLNESDFSLNTPVVRMERSQPPVSLPWRSEIKSFAVSQEQLFVISALTNEPTGIWKLDLNSGALEQIVSNQERPFQFATSQPPIQNFMTNASGKRLTYYLLAPSHVKPGQPAPLVFGVMGKLEQAYNWDRYAQTIANCGYYFVIVDRRNSAVNEWADEALSVYEALVHQVSVDTNRVYALGISVGAVPINQLLARRPELWRGAMYYSPNSLPDPARLKASRILIDIGELDKYSGENNRTAKDFRDAAARAGVNVTLFIRPGVGHNCRLLSIEKERLHQLAAFLGRP
ncbi:MAG: hypothetical protein KIS67_24505 [Verrucomicrobiae bacterium]|nr:hypothetical protein [Verrucomicrobiae bacterium]